MDLWGNIKMPLYRPIENRTLDEWKPVDYDWDSPRHTYGSLIGVPVYYDGPKYPYRSFNVRARQFDIACSSNEMQSEVKGTHKIWPNSTSTWRLMDESNAIDLGYPRTIISMSLVAEQSGQTNISVATCAVNYIYLEAEVNCNGTSCAADSVRKLDLFSDGYTREDDLFTRKKIIPNLMSAMSSLEDDPEKGLYSGSSNAEKWMADFYVDSFIGQTYDHVALYKMSLETFSMRLTILWNTFHQSTFATKDIGGAPLRSIQGGWSSETAIYSPAQANVVGQILTVYRTNWKWFVALLCSSLVLLFAAYAGLILKYITLAPDIIGFASSLTILNPYVPTRTGGTTLHGLERAALLHDLPVRIGDVCADESVGAIAFAKADEGKVARLDRRRLYI